jgi:hypothetical protein
MTTSTVTPTSPVKTFPWGGQVLLEIPLHKKSANKFYARHGCNADGIEFLEFSKFGPIPNVEGKTYSQKMRLFSPVQWIRIKHYVESELVNSIGWDLDHAAKEFEKLQKEAAKKEAAGKDANKK